MGDNSTPVFLPSVGVGVGVSFGVRAVRRLASSSVCCLLDYPSIIHCFMCLMHALPFPISVRDLFVYAVWDVGHPILVKLWHLFLFQSRPVLRTEYLQSNMTRLDGIESGGVHTPYIEKVLGAAFLSSLT